ncbi:MAG: Lrp/AsnC ligand binding domain-containing protein [Clostridia bacterium]|nr:Lrp/AsnC ligand binding domain-containing protein [Clostridia bacterium]
MGDNFGLATGNDTLLYNGAYVLSEFKPQERTVLSKNAANWDADKVYIDKIDQKILSFLVKNARMPFLEIARECGVSGAAIHQRYKRLEANGVITGSRLQVKPQALGLNVCAYVSISLSESTKYPEVIANLKKIPEIVECHFVTGKYAILAKLYCLDNDHLMEVLRNTIQKIPYIQSTDTMISLDEPIERQVWVKEFKSTTYTGRD